MIVIKRIHDPPVPSDGYRVLVDRLWPRGIAREKAAIGEWLRDIAPSDALRRWFAHRPDRWDGFVRRYREELSRPEAAPYLARLRELAGRGTLTLVYAARDEARNNARVLCDVLNEAAPTRAEGGSQASPPRSR